LPNGRRRPPAQSPVPLLRIVLVVGLMVAGSMSLSAARSPAAATPSSGGELERRLEGLNRQADQQVEEYLQAKLAVGRTRGSIRILQRQLDGVRSQLADARSDPPPLDPANLTLGGAWGELLVQRLHLRDQHHRRRQHLPPPEPRDRRR
jgi:hypothetical protein